MKQFERPERSKIFLQKAATREKRRKEENFDYDFSWNWLTSRAAQMGLAYGTDQHWYIREHKRKVEKEVVVINKKATVNKKRTVEATEQVWKIWD